MTEERTKNTMLPPSGHYDFSLVCFLKFVSAWDAITKIKQEAYTLKSGSHRKTHKSGLDQELLSMPHVVVGPTLVHDLPPPRVLEQGAGWEGKQTGLHPGGFTQYLGMGFHAGTRREAVQKD